MLSVGEGLYQGVSTSFGDLRLDTIIVLPGALYFTADFRQTIQAEMPPAQPGETF